MEIYSKVISHFQYYLDLKYLLKRVYSIANQFDTNIRKLDAKKH